MSNTPTKASYSIINILITDSHFHRSPDINFQAGGIETSIDVNVDANKADDGNLIVGVKAKFTGTQFQNEIFAAEVLGVGVFRKDGESDLNEESFMNVNAPAIIFPFVREHISSLGLKAGLGNIILPPINFVKKEPKAQAG